MSFRLQLKSVSSEMSKKKSGDSDVAPETLAGIKAEIKGITGVGPIGVKCSLW